MNGLEAALAEIIALAGRLRDPGFKPAASVMICPPATLLAPMVAASQGSPVTYGGQDCHASPAGAHTGDVSAEMLKDAGATAVIVGHSERRADHDERDIVVRAKAEAAHRAGLLAIVCVGETAGERARGLTLAVVERQLSASLPKSATAANTVVAYEPVWAIGSGLTPTNADVAEVHAAIRGTLVATIGPGDGAHLRILYGGSVKPANARDLMSIADVDGALVGGASLKAADFLDIISVYA